MSAMRRHEAHMAVVMDQHGGTAGIVTIEDLFAEVVGDIEEGKGRPPIVSDTSGRLRVRGGVRLSEVGEALAYVIEHPRVTTVSGLVLALLGRPASIGDVVTYQNITIEVTSVAGRGVQEALITRKSRTEEQSPVP
jgi:CBS domain containing-hemolysin-like protein